MAYSDYTLAKIKKDFSVENKRTELFQLISPLAPSERLLKALQTAKELPVRSEKAKSELIVMPILLEIRDRNHKKITIYSGDSLNIDDSLRGECDFMVAKERHSYDLQAPILQIVEAKKNDVEVGIAQCAAQMIGAQKYNEYNQEEIPCVYGCVTTGDDWLFLRLRDLIEVDQSKYYLSQLPILLGVFQHILDELKITT